AAGDLVDRTGGEAGGVMRSKKGDFVVTLNPVVTAGAELRIVVEAKDRAMSGRAMRDELGEAKENRAAAVAPPPLPAAPALASAVAGRAPRAGAPRGGAPPPPRLHALATLRESAS